MILSVRRTGMRMLFSAFISLAGCAPQGGSPSSLMKAHSKSGWIDPSSQTFHGSFLSKTGFDKTTCAQCHGIDFKGGEVEVSCYDCHAYPHIGDQVANHPAQIKAGIATLAEIDSDPEGSKNYTGFFECTPCHAPTGKEKNNRKSDCAVCHSGGTFGITDHSSIQAVIANHGEKAQKGTAPCETCHAIILNAEKSNQTVFFSPEGETKAPTACSECHTVPENKDPKAFMHWGIEGWKPTSNTESGKHPNYLFIDSCSPCHGEFPELSGKKQDGIQVIKGCSSCHAGFYGKFKHVDPLATHKENLISSAAELGISSLEVAGNRCIQCHSLTEDKEVADQYTLQPKIIPSCSKCHPLDHLQKKWSKNSPTDPATHTGYLQTKFYNPETWELKLGADGGNCEACHFNKGKQWNTCKKCHAPYPAEHLTYNPKWITPKDPSSHGKYKDSYSTTCATLCHGADLQGGGSGVACNFCHANLP